MERNVYAKKPVENSAVFWLAALRIFKLQSCPIIVLCFSLCMYIERTWAYIFPSAPYKEIHGHFPNVSIFVYGLGIFILWWREPKCKYNGFDHPIIKVSQDWHVTDRKRAPSHLRRRKALWQEAI